MSKREELLNEFYNLYVRQLYENGLCEEDKKRFEDIKVALLDNGDITKSHD